MKKLFGGINLTWKKLIIFAIVSAIYTAVMAMIPITKDTSFRDIAIEFEWWIFFGIIIICNSKSPKDSALKCFVFFLISQPLIYLIQVPFSSMGWEIFKFYRYWFIWTLLCLPMGFIGYYIKKKNWLSVIILLPMLMILAFLGLGYFTSAYEHFPNHLLSFISCYLMIIVIVRNLFDKTRFKIVIYGVIVIATGIYGYLNGGIIGTNYETYKSLDSYGIKLVGEVYVSSFTGTAQGNIEVIYSDGEVRSVKLNGRNNGEYTFTLLDDTGSEYSFEYHYDKEQKTVVLNQK